jgi:hypothetical protein
VHAVGATGMRSTPPRRDANQPEFIMHTNITAANEMASEAPPVRLAGGVSLNTYPGAKATCSWSASVVGLAPLPPGAGPFVLPAFPCLVGDAQQALSGASITRAPARGRKQA